MLRIRLRRVGKKGKPSYRIVVADSRAPRDGDYIEWIGNYDPMADPPAITLKEDRAAQWLSKGAQPSDAVARILDKNGLFQRTQQFRSATGESADEAPATTVVSTVPTEVTVVEVAASTEATVDEAAAEVTVEEAPEESTEPDAPVDEVRVDEEAAEAPAEDEAAEAPADEAPADEETAEAADEEEPDEAAQE